VDYLHRNSPNLICVINTTGTPYYQRQPLRDVVAWYGVSQGIRDRILKDVTDNFRQFEIGGHADKFVHHVVTDFFTQYGTVCLPNGSPAKLAVYFPQMNELQELRPVIDKALVEVGQSPAMCLVNTSDQHLTKQTDIDA
jgi:type III restriction enzyme